MVAALEHLDTDKENIPMQTNADRSDRRLIKTIEDLQKKVDTLGKRSNNINNRNDRNSNKNIASNSKGNYFHDVGDAHSFNDYFQSYTLNDDGFLTKE